MSNEPRRIKWLLEAVTDDIDKLTDWEQSFVQSVDETFHLSDSLSDKQYDKLEKIYEERCQ